MNTDDFNPNESILDEGIDLEKYWRILKPKIHIPIFLGIIFLIGVFVKNSMQPNLYYSEGMLLIEPEKNIVEFSNQRFFGYRNEYFNTQIRILQSDSLKRNVMEEIGVYPGSMQVTPIEFSNLTKISYMSTDPNMTARVVNTIFEKFIDFNLSLKTQSSRQASQYISKEVVDLRRQIKGKEEELQEYGKRREIFYTNRQNTTAVENFSDVNKAYTQARITRVNKESYYKELQSMPFNNYPEVKNNSVINGIRSSLSTLESKYQNKLQVYKESYPEMVQIRSEINSLQNRLDKETRKLAQKVLNEARTNFQTAEKQENSLSKMLDEQKGTMASNKSSAIYYQSLNIEIQNLRRLLDYLQKKQKESLVSSRLEGLQTSNIKIIDQARIPTTPISKKMVRSLLLALFMGLGLGIGIVYGLDFLDKSIKDTDDLKLLLKINPLGFVPSTKSKKARRYYYNYKYSKDDKETNYLNENIELINYRFPTSPFAESYRNIRTSILLSDPENPKKIITISSAKPGEGKSITAANLAYSFSKLGKQVLLMDCDLRKPRIHKIFKLKKSAGISSYLIGRSRLPEIVQKLDIPNLYLIQAGEFLQNSAELFQSEKMEALINSLEGKFDHIIIDLPPMIGIVDPLVISRYASGVILVIWGGKTSRNEVDFCKKEFAKLNIPVLGGILNNIDYKRESYGMGHNYSYNYTYKYSDD
jgi:capsular exopolysaccharide synthesis family protein